MTATADQIARLRRLVNEPDETTYSDDDLQDAIEAYPCLDERGEAPYTWDTATTPPTQDANESWIPTYDLHAAAAGIWEEKAAAVAGEFDFSADGGSYSRSQAYDHCMRKAHYHRARRKAKTARLHKWPEEPAAPQPWIGNLAEED